MCQSFGFALSVLLAFTLGLVSCKQPEQTAAPPALAVPTDKPIQISKVADASGDWMKQAHQVLVLTPVGAGAKAELSVAWTPSAFLVQVHTDDATPVETAGEPWNNDSVEIFMASSYGSEDHVQFICIPGRTGDPAKPSWHVYDKRTPALPAVAPEMHTQKEGNGYVMTISMPWANLNHIPKAGDVIGVQVYVNDAQRDGQLSHCIWFPENGTGDNPLLMQHVQLSDQADAPERAAAWLQAKGFNETVHVAASAEDSGKKIEIWSSGKQVGSSELKAGGLDGSAAGIPLSADLAKQKDTPLIVTVDGRPLPAVLKIPDLAKRNLDLIKKLSLVADPSIFDGAVFPRIDFVDKELVDAVIGSYSLHARFFDANWNEVTVPQAPGRYGALVEFRSEDGLAFTRHLTLFKTAQPYISAKDPYAATVKFPVAFDLPDDTLVKEQWSISDWTGGTLEGAVHESDDWAILVAGLHDLAADPVHWHGLGVWRIDGAWWSELRKRLGENQDYPHLTHLPDGYDKDQRAWPLILFLHGSGERGDDLNIVKNSGPIGYINSGHSLPFIVVTPQCPTDEHWDPARLARLIDQVSAANRVDPKRIYVTGLSMGGYGTFELAATYPEKFAAIAPLSGGENPEIAARLKRIPTWIFHGSDDTTVPTRYSVDIAHAMQKLGAPVKLTIYPGVGHGGWADTYANPELYAWLLAHPK